VDAVAPDFRAIIAARVDASQALLAERWLDELKRVVPVAERDIFAGDDLLGDITALIHEIAAFLRAPDQEAIAANAVVTARAADLGRLRHAQHASVHQVMREYRVLRTAVAEFIDAESRRLQLRPAIGDIIALMERVETAIDVVLQTTVDAFLAQHTRAITEHTSELEAFNRMVTHELRQPLGIFQFAVKMLAAEPVWDDAARRAQILATAERSITRMTETLGKLVALSRSGESSDSPLAQRVDLAALANDVRGQLREMAEARGVDVRIADGLPVLMIDAARIELVLVNLISNAIKYCDPNKPQRIVEVCPLPEPRPDVCAVSVRDNGIGIAESELRSIFARFYRGRPERDRELGATGLGLGLSIVADCIDAIKGDIRVASTLGQGTTFFLELPRAAPGDAYPPPSASSLSPARPR